MYNTKGQAKAEDTFKNMFFSINSFHNDLELMLLESMILELMVLNMVC